MFKKYADMNRTIHTVGYIVILIVILSLLAGCSKDSNPAGASDNPAPGFEISNLRYQVLKVGSKPSAGAYHVTVDYKGAEGGIKEVIGTIDGSYWSSIPIEGKGYGPLSGGEGSSGTVSTGGYGLGRTVSSNGTYTLQIYLRDKSGRDSDMLSSTFTVDFL